MRKKLCESLVLSILNYGFIVFYSCLDKITKLRLQKIQNSCCRFVYRIPRDERVSQRIVALGWLRVDDNYRYSLSVFFFNMLVTSSPPYLRGKFHFRSDDINVNVRNLSSLSVPRYRTTLFRRSFSYNCVIIYNSLPENLKMLSLRQFRKQLRKILLLSQ